MSTNIRIVNEDVSNLRRGDIIQLREEGRCSTFIEIESILPRKGAYELAFTDGVAISVPCGYNVSKITIQEEREMA